MPNKDRKPKARPSCDKWFVYLVRCADASLYTPPPPGRTGLPRGPPHPEFGVEAGGGNPDDGPAGEAEDSAAKKNPAKGVRHADLCRITGQRHEPCLLDTFIAAVRYMEGAPSAE